MFLLAGPNLPSAAQAIREVAEAITHAKFVGTNSASDEVVLMKILNVSIAEESVAHVTLEHYEYHGCPLGNGCPVFVSGMLHVHVVCVGCAELLNLRCVLV